MFGPNVDGSTLARQPQRLASEKKSKDLRRPHGLADRLGQRLALFAGKQLAELVLAREESRPKPSSESS
jgi:hypothetical protein